jgi:hypothetical protein
VPAAQLPNTLGLLERLFAGDLEEPFELGLEVLVKGLPAASES